MKKKGFTLVELLAVIVILAIIALIAIPLIGNVIEKAKIGALESSVNGLAESANMYYANATIKGETISETIFDFEDGKQTSDKKLEYKGKVYNGKLILHANGEVAVCIDDTEHYAYKNKDTDEVVSGTGTCLYDGTTGDFSSNSLINDLRGKTVTATTISESSDGLNALITIPEEGHYDENSVISVPYNKLNSNMEHKYRPSDIIEKYGTEGTLTFNSNNFTMQTSLHQYSSVGTNIPINLTNVNYIIFNGNINEINTAAGHIFVSESKVNSISESEKYIQLDTTVKDYILDVSDLSGLYYFGAIGSNRIITCNYINFISSTTSIGYN